MAPRNQCSVENSKNSNSMEDLNFRKVSLNVKGCRIIILGEIKIELNIICEQIKYQLKKLKYEKEDAIIKKILESTRNTKTIRNKNWITYL